MRRSLRVAAALMLFAISVNGAESMPFGHKAPGAKRLDEAAKAALAAMTKRAGELKIQGVAVVSFSPGASVDGWMSEMAVVGHMTDHTNGDKGNNLLAIAYAKASEMARTLKDSGTAGGTPMTGEFGWQGGVVGHVAGFTIIVAFSGGKSEDDVATSKAGLAVLEKML